MTQTQTAPQVRTAHCTCGQLRAELTGEPDFVAACHCEPCQRRSGSPFGTMAYCKRSQVKITGESKPYTRIGDSGFKFTTCFCPNCGSTVYAESERLGPDMIGITVGAFFDPKFPKPNRAVYDRSRHEWLSLGPGVERYEMGRDSKRVTD
jgi:hypothetical protein